MYIRCAWRRRHAPIPVVSGDIYKMIRGRIEKFGTPHTFLQKDDDNSPAMAIKL